jgi:hypothetical protein
MVPIRFISENLGTEVEWNQDERTITILGRDTIVFKINTAQATVNGKYKIDVDGGVGSIEINIK